MPRPRGVPVDVGVEAWGLLWRRSRPSDMNQQWIIAAPSRRTRAHPWTRWRRMSRRTVRLTLDNLSVPVPLSHVPVREMDPVRRARVADEDEAYAEKEAWVSTVLRDWGSCGRAALVIRGRGLRPLRPRPACPAPPTAPVSVDALQMTTLYVDPGALGGGFGRLLIQGMARDLIKRGEIRAVEAFGGTPRGGHGRCVVPADFLRGASRPAGAPATPADEDGPQVGSDWRDEVEQALDGCWALCAGSPPAPEAVAAPARS